MPIPSTMSPSLACLELIKHFEGMRLTAYICPGDVLTIGVGHTGPEVHEWQSITYEQAMDLLAIDADKAADAVRELVRVPLTQGQFDALTSFVFNLGRGAFAKSTLLRLLNQGDYSAAASEFDRWVKSGGQTLQGLVTRRNAEQAMFLGESWEKVL